MLRYTRTNTAFLVQVRYRSIADKGPTELTFTFSPEFQFRIIYSVCSSKRRNVRWNQITELHFQVIDMLD